jgi:hypothetical protein
VYRNKQSEIQHAINAIDFHCHGVGRFDFTDIQSLDLTEIEGILAERRHKTILTLYLPKINLNQFLAFMLGFSAKKNKGLYPHIEGIAIEGPLLSSRGGTPKNSLWVPTKSEWQMLANCGKLGLIYMIMSPDSPVFDNTEKTHRMDRPAHSIEWVAETLIKGGVLPSPGHFIKSNPKESASSLQKIFDVAAYWGVVTVTDHFLNDMPHNFSHAWRTADDRANRVDELSILKMDTWNINNIEDTLGLVPATIIRNAHKGHVKICQNFDGEHVDLEILRHILPIIGYEHILMMTDSIESACLAGQKLHAREDSTLLYESEGIVAAGSQGIDLQIKNLISLGLSDAQIHHIVQTAPSCIIKQHNRMVYDQAVGM